MWQPCRGSAAALAAAVLASSPLLGLAAGGGGDPIFELQSKKLDNSQFWIIFAGMVFYGLLIDRAQYFTQRAVENSRCSKMIFDRVVTEFMVFGIVAITIFVGTNLYPLNDLFPYSVTHLTYADVLVSFAACSLIVLGALYSWMRHRTEEHLQGFEGDEHNDTAIPKMGTWSPMRVNQQRVFLERNKLTDSFNWNMYFQESLAHQICDLINITWVTWLVTFIILLPMVFYKSYIGTDPAKASAYISGFLFTTWFFCLLTLATVIMIRLLRGKLYAALDRYLKTKRPVEVDSDSEDSDSDTHELDLDTVEKSMRWWSDFLAWLMQFESLIVCFLLGMYVMNITYNLKVYKDEIGIPALWYQLGFLVPLVFSLAVLIPLGLVELTSIQAFCSPDQEVLHTIISEVRQAHTDLVFIQNQIMNLGYSSIQSAHAKSKTVLLAANDGDDTVKRMDLMGLLVSIDVHLTKERSLAVFDLVDQEHAANPGTKNKTFMLKVRNCIEDVIDTQVHIDDLLDSALSAKMDGKKGKSE